MNTESFEKRHIGPTDIEIDQMLKFINAKSLDNLIDQTIPKSIRNTKKMVLDPPMSESDYLMHLKKISSLNKVYKTYIGMGYKQILSSSCNSKKYFRKSWLVYCLHTLPSRNCSGQARSIIEFSNNGN